MGEAEVPAQPTNQPVEMAQASPNAPFPASHTGATTMVRSRAGSCPTCGATVNANAIGAQTSVDSYIYAIGRIEARFPSLALEKEFAQATRHVATAGQTDRQVFQSVLAERANRYLVRQLCWVLSIEGLETYILVPRDSADFDLLVEAIRSEPGAGDLDVVVGIQGPIAPPELCNGLMVPIVMFDQIYSFDHDEFVRAIPRPKNIEAAQFERAAGDLFDQIMQMADNAGATDEHRALNYCAVRYPAIYARTSEAHGQNFGLAGVEVRPSRLSGVRKIVDVILSYTNRQTDVGEKYFVRVDVTEEFPFLVTKLSPFYER